MKEVRLSSRLTSSPACLVVSEEDVSPNLEKLFNQMKGETSKQKRIMELNPNHEIIAKMRDRCGGCNVRRLCRGSLRIRSFWRKVQS